MMSRRYRLPARVACGLLLAAMFPAAWAATPPSVAPPDPGTALPAWEQLSAEQREALVAPIRDRWNAEGPVKRQRMLDHARRWQELTPEQRQRARHGRERWQHMSPEERAHSRALFREMRGMSPGERDALKARWRQMSPEQRRAWVEQHGGGD